MKLLRILETPDGKNGFERALEYDDRIITFTKQRVTVQNGDKLYDWYGREIAFGDNIERIVKPFGTIYNGDGISEAGETFIVLLKNGNLAIARTEQEQGAADENLPWHKIVLTGGMLGRRTKLVTSDSYEFEREAAEIYETPVYQTFLKNMQFPAKLHVFSGLIDTGLRPECRKRMTVFVDEEKSGFSHWQFHNFVKDRATLMATPAGKEPEHGWATFIVGDIIVSEDGHKLSAEISSMVGSNRVQSKISTDVEALEHVGAQFGMFWYYDL